MKQFLVTIGGLMAGFLLMIVALYLAGYKTRLSRQEQMVKKSKAKSCGKCTDCTCGSLSELNKRA